MKIVALKFVAAAAMSAALLLAPSAVGQSRQSSGKRIVESSKSDVSPELAEALRKAVSKELLTAQTPLKIFADDGAANDEFGFSVAIDGDTAIVGAERDDVGTVIDQGSAYVFIRSGNTWVQQAKLVASDGRLSNWFGHSVAISGNTAIVGAIQTDGNRGSVYVFERQGGTWTESAKLTASDGAVNDLFGMSIAIDGDALIVGSNFADIGANANQGAAYIFVRSESGWVEAAKVFDQNGGADDRFGFSVDISGNRAVVGAYQNETSFNNQGAANVFVRSGSTVVHEAKLIASDAGISDQFGYSVSIDGDTLVVGANLRTSTRGAAYVFTRTGALFGSPWVEQQILEASDGVGNDRFGSSISIDGDAIAVGANFADLGPATNAGAAYVFKRSGGNFSEVAKIADPDAGADDRAASSVAVAGDLVIVGALFDDVGANQNQGSAQVLCLVCNDWRFEGEVVPSDGVGFEQFGYTVAIDGDTAVVGAPYATVGANSNQGAAYVFVRKGDIWHEQMKLAAFDAEAGDQFGYSVAISGDTIVVGAYNDSFISIQDHGSAYVFVRSGSQWTIQQKLFGTPTVAFGHFGSSVAIDGDTLIVGEKDEQIGSHSGQGSATVFVRNFDSWSQQQKLTASDGAALDHFGISVSLEGDLAVVGGSGRDSQRGAAWVFSRFGAIWTQRQILLDPVPAANDEFGISVGIRGATIVVGAVGDDVPFIGSPGSAFVFAEENGNWIMQRKLNASDAQTGDQFGASVAISGDQIIVGSYFSVIEPSEFSQGAAYIFERDGGLWTERRKLAAPDGDENYRFGTSVAIDGDTAVVGAIVGGDIDQGSAYFSVNRPRSAPTGYFTIGGRTLSSTGGILSRIPVALIESDGTIHVTRSGSFGTFRFSNIGNGQTVTLVAGTRRVRFTRQLVAVESDRNDVALTANDSP